MLSTRTVLRFQKSKLKGIQESHVGLLYKSFPFLYFKADWLQFINEENNMGHKSIFVALFSSIHFTSISNVCHGYH